MKKVVWFAFFSGLIVGASSLSAQTKPTSAEVLDAAAEICGGTCRATCRRGAEMLRDESVASEAKQLLIQACQRQFKSDRTADPMKKMSVSMQLVVAEQMERAKSRSDSFDQTLAAMNKQVQETTQRQQEAISRQQATAANESGWGAAQVPQGPTGADVDIDALLNDSSTETESNDSALDDLVSRLVGADVPALPSFQEAQKALQQADGFAGLEAEARSIEYSVEELRAAFDKLQPQRSSMNTADWQRNMDQIGDMLSKKELVEAATQPCSLDYLEKFNDDRRWQHTCRDPLHLATTNFPYGTGPACAEPQLQYRVEAPLLQRLCAVKLRDKLTQAFSEAGSTQELDDVASRYLSRPVLSGEVGSRGGEPRRIMSDKQWLPEVYEHREALVASFARDERDKQFQTAFLAGLDSSGIMQWLAAHRERFQDAQSYYQSVARSAEFQLDAASEFGDQLIERRARVQEAEQLVASYMPPQSSMEPPKYKLIRVYLGFACAGMPDLLARLVERPQTITSADYAEFEARLRACDTGVVGFDSRRRQSLRRQYKFNDYDTALSIDSAEGRQIAARIEKEGNQRLEVNQALSRKLNGFYGYDYADLYAAIEFHELLEKLSRAILNSSVGGVAFEDSELVERVVTYYETVTGLPFSDRDAALARVKERQEQEAKELFLAKQRGQRPPTVKVPVPTDQELVSAHYEKQCFDSMRLVDCGCFGNLMGKRAVTGDYRTDGELQFSGYGECLDREEIKASQRDQCLRGLRREKSFCDCYADHIAAAANSDSIGSGRQMRVLAGNASSACN